MKKLAIILCLGLSSACATVPTSPMVCSSTTVVDNKVAYAAEALYNVPANAYMAANESGKLTPELKAKVKPILQQMYKYLLLVRTAKDSCAYDNLLSLSTQVKTLLGA